jgi:hypothetical protein
MNRLSTCNFLIFILLSYLYSCNQPIKNTESFNTQKKDSNFIMTDVVDLDFVDKLNWDFDNLYLDSLKNKKFEKLSNANKLKYLKGLLKFEDGTEIQDDWIEGDLQAFIIGTRPKIGNFQPTLIKIYGTDYAGVFLININESGNVISSYPIYDLENSGPEFSDSTMIISRPKTKCKFEKNSILLSRLVGTCYPKNVGLQEFNIKQINYKTTINESGEIVITKLDSSQYTKKCNLEYFQSY